jgi:molybdate transport system substrate-binding protein
VATIHVLSAGAPKGGVGGTAEAFERKSGHGFAITFATAPKIKETVEGGAAEADVVVATEPAVDGFDAAGLIQPGARTVIGSVKAGVVVREGAEVPDISSAAALKEALLAADAIVRNEASSGLYIARMIEGLGIAPKVAEKTVCLPTGGDVLAYLAESDSPRAIGFGQITEIRRVEAEGRIRLVGPLPKEVENITTYAAAALNSAEDPEAAAAYVAFLDTAEARHILVASGVE